MDPAEEGLGTRPVGLRAGTSSPLLPARVVAAEEVAGRVEMREPPLLVSEVELERRLNLAIRPTGFELRDLLLAGQLVLLTDGASDALASVLELLDLLLDLLDLLLHQVIMTTRQIDELDGGLTDLGIELLNSRVRLDLRESRFSELLLDLLLRVVEAHHVGESERQQREQLERIHGHDLVAHGPLLLSLEGFSGTC